MGLFGPLDIVRYRRTCGSFLALGALMPVCIHARSWVLSITARAAERLSVVTSQEDVRGHCLRQNFFFAFSLRTFNCSTFSEIHVFCAALMDWQS